MELIVLIGIACFFGALALSMIGQRHTPPPAPMVIIRAEMTERTAGDNVGGSLLLLLLVIGVAVWLL